MQLPLQEAGVGLSVGEAGTPHPDVLQQAQVFHLVAAALQLEQQWGFDIVGFDAADVVRFLQGATVGLSSTVTMRQRCGGVVLDTIVIMNSRTVKWRISFCPYRYCWI